MYAKHILFSLVNISDDLPMGSYRGHLAKFLHCKKPLYCTFFKKLQKEILYTYIYIYTHTHIHIPSMYIFVVVELLSNAQLSATLWTAARQASSSFTITQSLLKLMSIESVMPSNHLVFCCPFLFLSSINVCLSIYLYLWVTLLYSRN